MYTSRPVSWSAVYGVRPLTGSVVDFWKYSGTISTRPPTLTTATMSATIHGRLRSMRSCESFTAVSLSGGRDGNRDRRLVRAGARDGAGDVVGHHQHAGEEHHPAGEPDRVERIGRLDAFHERVRERPVRVGRAPHESLHHAGDPHGGDVEHHAERG